MFCQAEVGQPKLLDSPAQCTEYRGERKAVMDPSPDPGVETFHLFRRKPGLPKHRTAPIRDQQADRVANVFFLRRTQAGIFLDPSYFGKAMIDEIRWFTCQRVDIFSKSNAYFRRLDYSGGAIRVLVPRV